MSVPVHYWLYGLLLLVASLFALWQVISRTGHILHTEHVYKASTLPSAYCTAPGIHANCLFSQSICYHNDSKTWHTSALPFPNWGGVSLRSRGSLFRDSPIHAGCNNPFVPQLQPFPAKENIHWINGTNVISCIWTTIFGHIFLEMMLPAWMAMQNLADRLHLSNKNIRFIMDYRCHATLAEPLFSLLSHQPVFNLTKLVEEARLNGKSYLCFERLIIGYRLQSSLEYAHNVAHLENGDLARYRDAVKTLHGLPLQVNMSAGVCIALLVQRNVSRRIVRESEQKIVEMLRERTLCTVKVATFDGIPILEQVRLVANAAILVHVSGSGSHQFIWLPDGAASVTIVHPHVGLNVIGHGGVGGGGLILNDFLCWKHPTILCVTAGAKAFGVISISDVEVDTYSFSNALDMIKLWQHRGKFDPRDQTD